MNRSPKGARILVASDNVDDAAQVQRALADDFDSVEVSSRPELAVADFERVMPDVVVLAFDAVEKSQQYCLGLLRLSKVAHAHPHRTVILCAKDDLGSVFDLCKKEYFDDYVLYWPQAHDGLRLAMSVWNACRRAGGSSEAGLPTSEIARPVVLVVEDDPFAAKLIAKALEKQSFDVAIASNAPGVLARLRSLKPAAIFMDVNLPGMDGVALTEWLKASPTHSHIPVIMLTGDARRETIARSMTAGAVGFIVKPFTREGLLAKLAPFVH